MERRRWRQRNRVLAFEVLEERFVLSVAPLGIDDSSYELWRQQSFTLDDVDVGSADLPISTASFAPPTSVTGTSMYDADAGRLIGLDKVAQSYSYTGAGYSVAIIDTGIDYTHSALGGGWGNRVIAGYDFVNNDADPMDDEGHGTHIAGIIGGNSATFTGIAPQINFIALKVLSAAGTGSFGAVEDALQWVVAHQAQYNIVAVNMSLGSGIYTSNPYTFLEDEFSALKSQGVFISSAAGNGYYTVNSAPGVIYPAISPQAVAVGAVWDANVGDVEWGSAAHDFATAPDRIVSFSNRGPQVDLFAPGAYITSTFVNNSYVALAGTSMATPTVAAAAALLHQAFDSIGRHDLANQDSILAVLQNTGATIRDGDDENDNVNSTNLTFKRLDIFAALQNVVPNPAAVALQATLPFRDDFVAGDSNFIGMYWSEKAGNLRIASGKLTADAGTAAVARVNGASATDVSLSAIVDARSGNGSQAGLIARYGGTGDRDMYYAALVNRGSYYVEIYRNVGGVWTMLSQAAVGVGTGTLRFDVVGSSLSAFFNGQLISTVIDTAITAAGAVGVRGIAATFDQFTAVSMGLSLPTNTPIMADVALPFADDFTGPNGSFTGNPWVVKSGGFSRTNNQIRGAGGVYSVATLNNVVIADVAVESYVDATSFNTAAGVVARYYERPYDTELYEAIVTRSGSQYFAEIWKSAGGTFTRLSSQQVGVGAGTLRFEVVGSSLTLFFNNQKISQVKDSSIVAAGQVGIWSGNGLLDSFRATSLNQPIALPFSDAFNRADSAIPGAGWNELYGDHRVSGNQLISAGPDYAMTTLNGVVATNVHVQATVGRDSDGSAGLIARANGPDTQNMYVGLIYREGAYQYGVIWRNASYGWTLLAASNALPASTGTLAFDVNGSSLQLRWNGQLIASATDTMNPAPGSVGVYSWRAGSRFDNFMASLITSGNSIGSTGSTGSISSEAPAMTFSSSVPTALVMNMAQSGFASAVTVGQDSPRSENAENAAKLESDVETPIIADEKQGVSRGIPALDSPRLGMLELDPLLEWRLEPQQKLQPRVIDDVFAAAVNPPIFEP